MNTIQKCKHGLAIYNRKDLVVGKSLDAYGEYLENQIKLIKCFLNSNDTIYDIGASNGCLTLPFARLVSKGSVFAFEPERHNFHTLCGNIAINNIYNTYCYQYAIGNKSGSIFVPELNHENIFDQTNVNLNKQYNCNGYNAILTTIDSIKSSSCKLLKINNSGMEIDALQGGLETINAHKPYILVNNNNKNKSNELIEFLKSLNYKVFFIKQEFFNNLNFYNNKENLFFKNDYDSLFCYHEKTETNTECLKKFDLVIV